MNLELLDRLLQSRIMTKTARMSTNAVGFNFAPYNAGRAAASAKRSAATRERVQNRIAGRAQLASNRRKNTLTRSGFGDKAADNIMAARKADPSALRGFRIDKAGNRIERVGSQTWANGTSTRPVKDPTARAGMLASINTKKMQDPEYRARVDASNKKIWATNDAFKAQLQAQMNAGMNGGRGAL